ncbi:hypothetical protein B0F90DRAFT_1952683 [Multifurca ochricompacta]|uniref:Macrofage activating glycoprotein n=1 Tax=Multifurca ochricompacta TaxID=376703 RepID=A0AAD4M0Q6_9AGAM|nr:hypothetical protein B0F90DRAFT_1952683 [Multifurca ochricompacta]
MAMARLSNPVVLILSLLAFQGVRAQTYSATYLPSNAPNQSEQGQTGTNKCGTGSNQTSQCQNAYLNSIDDWCIFAPPDPGPGSVIGNTERIEVAWCIKVFGSHHFFVHATGCLNTCVAQSGYGTRVIPDGTISGAHFVQTPDYVQITGIGDLTKINIPAGDAGGELDPHGADGNGNPIGGLVFSNAFTGQFAQLHEWTNFVSSSEFCFRGCKDGPRAPALCQHIYDVMGCDWNMPGNYGNGFDKCAGDTGEPMGVYGSSTFFQGQPVTPPAHPAPATSSCTTTSSIGNNLAVQSANTSTSTSSSPTSSPASGTSGSSAVSRTSSVTNLGPTKSPNGALMGAQVPALGVLLGAFSVALAGATVSMQLLVNIFLGGKII